MKKLKFRIGDKIKLKPNIDYNYIYLEKETGELLNKHLNKVFTILEAEDLNEDINDHLHYLVDISNALPDMQKLYFNEDNLIKINTLKQKIKFIKELL